ncbi:SGNH/GDSL hydrolase family protein [Streptomyces sp. NPDC000410]|uniref:SGNH/GDSL hydrolase family protein n=1 Tax=Streptomyces sp. NPDC000410 TaxID=3154254 RepID=UPI00331E8C36
MRRTVSLVVLAALAPGALAGAANPEPVRTVVLGDAYVAGYGIAPVDEGDGALLCVRAKENLPDVVADQLGDQSVLLDVRADVSCTGARVGHVWEPQDLGGGMTARPQKEALAKDTGLVVVGLGADTLGLARVLKQCSARLRGTEGALLPDTAVAADSPAAGCRSFFEKGAGAPWLKDRFEETGKDLDKLFSEIGSESPDAKTVLVGYPRLVPADPKRCLEKVPEGDERPLADVPEDAMAFLDRHVQVPLNDLMRSRAQANGARFVDLYAASGAMTACDGKERAIGGLLEKSGVTLLHQPLPWFLRANETGRDVFGDAVARVVADLYGK